MEKATAMENNIHEDRNENEIEINILGLLFVFGKKAWVIILIALTGCLGSGIYSKMISKPVYTSTFMVYILSKETTLTSPAGLQIGSQLTKDYSIVITSRPVLEQVIENQGLNLSYTQLKDMMRISNPVDAGILNMSMPDTDPVRTRIIVGAVVKASSDYIGDIMEMIPPKTIENGVVPSVPTSPNIKRDAALGGLAMIVTACDIIFLQVTMNDTIRSEKDVSRYLGISVLAAIPGNGKAEDNPLIQKNKRKKSREKQKPVSKKG